MFKLILMILIIVFLASILRCDETSCDLTCGAGPRVRKTLKEASGRAKETSKEVIEELKD